MRIEDEEKNLWSVIRSCSPVTLCFHGVCTCVCVHLCAHVCVAWMLEIPEYSYIKAWPCDTDCAPASLKLRIA